MEEVTAEGDSQNGGLRFRGSCATTRWQPRGEDYSVLPPSSFCGCQLCVQDFRGQAAHGSAQHWQRLITSMAEELRQSQAMAVSAEQALASKEAELSGAQARAEELERQLQEATAAHRAGTEHVPQDAVGRPVRARSSLRACWKVGFWVALVGVLVSAWAVTFILSVGLVVGGQALMGISADQLARMAIAVQEQLQGMETALVELKAKHRQLADITELEHHVQQTRGVIKERLDEKDKDGDTMLMRAAIWGHLDTVQLLTKGGADVNSANKKGQTAAMYAATRGHLEIFEHLLKNGADADARDEDDWPPLFFAAHFGRLNVVEFIINKGGDVNAKNKHGFRPLICAAVNGHAHVVQFLLDHGADANVWTKIGGSALILAKAHGHQEVVRLLEQHGAKW